MVYIYTSIHYMFIHSIYQALATGLGVNINPMVYSIHSIHSFYQARFSNSLQDSDT